MVNSFDFRLESLLAVFVMSGVFCNGEGGYMQD